MKLPPRGAVIRYSYLWAREQDRGLTEGRKDRPAVVVYIAALTDVGAWRTYVAAVTHAPPSEPKSAVPFPLNVKRSLGLDSDPAWIVTNEVNTFLWPGPDIRPVPGRTEASRVYGVIPDALLKRVLASIVANGKRARVVKRTQ